MRPFLHVLLIAPLLCVSCSGGSSSVDDQSRQWSERRQSIEDKYRPQYPDSSHPLHRAGEVLSGNELLLDSGDRLTLLGVDCAVIGDVSHSKMLAEKHGVAIAKVNEFAALSREYLKRMLEDEELQIVLMEATTSDGVLTGYLWIVDESLMNDPELKGVVLGPMFTCVNEAILSSGWAFAADIPAHPMSAKYKALQDLAKQDGVGLWAK